MDIDRSGIVLYFRHGTTGVEVRDLDRVWLGCYMSRVAWFGERSAVARLVVGTAWVPCGWVWVVREGAVVVGWVFHDTDKGLLKNHCDGHDTYQIKFWRIWNRNWS